MNRRHLTGNRILILPVVLALSALLLFVSQGGFGGGHGSFDRAIWILGLPGILATTSLPVWPGDFLALVLLPALLNLVLWIAVVAFVRAHLRADRGERMESGGTAISGMNAVSTNATAWRGTSGGACRHRGDAVELESLTEQKAAVDREGPAF